MMHIRYNYGYDTPNDPVKDMKRLGIKYKFVMAQIIADQYWFWNCENIPDPLPSYLTELNADPMEWVGCGLSMKDAIEIKNCKKQNENKTN
jgi:hypothetical protein